MRTHGLWMIPAVAALVVGCDENPAIDGNNAPVAVAWVDGEDIPRIACTDGGDDDECPVDEVARRKGVEIAFTGSDVTVTLDGTRSADRDGRVVGYRWLSANFGPDCMGRDDDSAHDPDDVAKPEVTLGEGFWEFGLWVEDDDGEFSEQSVVTVNIGDAADPCPNGPGGSGGGSETGADAGLDPTEQCILDCADDMCPMEAAACAADENCWPLNRCVAENCADVNPADTLALITCSQTNCGPYLAGATNSIAVGPCAMACQADCSSM